MVLFNYSTKELTAKIVYYGPGLCGKTTNLQFIFDNLPSNIHKGKMLSLATKTDRTLFFDFLPIDLGTIRGMRTRLQLYTVPGQVFYNTTRKLVLKGADGLVFVADSQKKMLDANTESFRNMETNLIEHGMNLETIPHVLQFNKRDLKDVLSVEELNAALNKHNVPIYEAVATTGIGVQDTLKAVTRLVLNSLREKYSDGRKPVSRAPAAPPPAPEPRAATPPEAEPEALEAIPEAVSQAEPVEEALEVEPEPVLELAEDEPQAAAEPPEAEAAVEEPEPVLAVAEEAEAEAEPVAEEVAEEVEVLEAGEEVSGQAPALQAAEGAPISMEIPEEPEAMEVLPEEPLRDPAAPVSEPAAPEPSLEDAPLGAVEEAAEDESGAFEIEIPAAGEAEPSPLPETGPDGSTVAIDVTAASVEEPATPPAAAGAPADMAGGATHEATIPLTVEVQGRPVHLRVTVAVRVDKS